MECGNRRPLGKPLRHEGMVKAVAFNPDGLTVLTGSSDHTARLWSAETGAPRRADATRKRSRSCGVQPYGRTVLTGSRDCTAQLWDAATSAPMGEPLRHEVGVDVVAFSPDGRIAATGWGDILEFDDIGGARLWALPSLLADAPPERLRLTITMRTGRNTSEDGGMRMRLIENHDELWRDLATLNGPMLPFSDIDRERMNAWYHRGSTRESERAEQWFSAAFHLGQLLKRTPGDPALLRRYQRAMAELGK